MVGFMGSGKSTVGKILAQSLDQEFVEMDALIEKSQAKEISAIFAQEGESYFRQLEKDLLKELAKKTDLVVSCGGGLVCDPQNIELLKKTGLLVCLSASADTIYERTKEYTSRPLLEVKDPLSKIQELLVKREPYYQQAHHTVSTDNSRPKEISETIIKIIKENNG